MSKYIPICHRRDLRGKTVRLRSGERVCIPLDASRKLPVCPTDVQYIAYVWHSRIDGRRKTFSAFDIHRERNKLADKVSNDITKVCDA